MRSCSNFAGYLKRPQWNNTDADGWVDTGDVAYMDKNGYIRISGRSKDVIIRGGENIPVVEVEALLYKHPAVARSPSSPIPTSVWASGPVRSSSQKPARRSTMLA